MKVFLAVLFAFIYTSLAAQKNELDSLMVKLSNVTSESEKAIILYSIGKETLESNPDSALYFVIKSKKIIDSLNLDSLRGAMNIIFSSAYSYKADYAKSTQLAFEALDHGNVYENDIVKYDAYSNLGIDFMYQEEYDKANEYFNSARKIAKKIHSSYRLAHALNNLGMISYYLGDSDEELRAYQQALEIFREIEDREGIGNTTLNIGTCYTVMEQFSLADVQYKKALKIFDEIDYRSAYGHALESQAENYALAGNFSKAIIIANEALELFIENDNKQDQAYCYKLLEDIYEQQHNFKSAYFYQKKYQEVFNEIYNEEKTELVQELHLKYATAKKETKIARLELSHQKQEQKISKARLQILMMVGSLIFIISAAIVFFILLKKKQKADQLAQHLQYEALQKRYLEILNGPSSFNLEMEVDELNQKLHNPLTTREFEILELSLKGKTNQEVADTIFVSLSTVKFHLGNVYNKLGVSNKKQALEYVVKV